jgi:hypothetical protein
VSISASTRRFALALTLALSLAALVAALLGPTQTLAQARGSSCSGAHAKTKCTEHACSQSSHKGRAHHTSKCHVKRTSTKKSPKTHQATTPAYCEDASAPVRAMSGSFSCEDGSEPQCDEGAQPQRSANGKSLVCPVLPEEEPSAGETECEEGLGATCSAGDTSPAVSEPTCEASASAAPSSLCEAES